MAVNYTPHQTGESLDASGLNSRLQELDDAIEGVKDGSVTLVDPTITDFTNAQHDHEDAAGGGQITFDAIDSTALATDESPVADGAGGWVYRSVALPPGVMLPYGGSSAPTGWLLCDGSAVSRTTYADLFAIISTTFGVGDGASTFNVPDLRGRVPLGADNMGGSSANRVTATQADNLGQGSGAETHTLVSGEMPAHTHTTTLPTNSTAGGSVNHWAGNNSGSSLASTTSSTGGGGAHNNVQPYQTVNYLIKT